MQETQEQYARLQQPPEAAASQAIPPEVRAVFGTLGQSLPELWHQETLNRAQRKALLRCLIDTVVLDRRVPDTITTRIVWRGGAMSELDIACSVGRLADLSTFSQLETQVLRLESRGKSDEEIAQLLTIKGFRSSHHADLLPSTVRQIRLQQGRLHRYWGPRPRRVPGSLTVPQVATAVGVKPHWIYHLISRGRIGVTRNKKTGLYLFPDRPETLEAFRQLRDGAVSELTY